MKTKLEKLPRLHRKRMSNISIMHYIKLVFRSLLFLSVLAAYLVTRLGGKPFQIDTGDRRVQFLMLFVWVVFLVEMLLRFFPSRLESMGCQKQFARNYQPTGKAIGEVKKHAVKPVLAIIAFWVLLNGALGAAYYLHLIDQGILILVSLAYSVCDMICILFFCPFQTWAMKNKCCTSCRIYNWDYAMMFTPLLFLPDLFTWSLLGFSAALLIWWEISYLRHPERFLEATNSCLSCKNCKEKLCHHKRQLQHFLVENRKLLNLKDNLPVKVLRKLTKKDTDET